MTHGKEFRSRFFALQPIFKYLSDRDRYLFAFDQPKYRFNIIGTGMNGQEHLKITLLEGRATVHGIFEPHPGSVEGAKQLYSQYGTSGELILYDSLKAACHDPEVDGLIICTPNFTHIEIAREAIKSGKHILLEKPMATTIQDAYEIIQLAEGYDAVFQVGLQYRYKAMYVEAIYEALTRKSIGDIKMITLQEHRLPFMDKVNQWNKFANYSGGTLVEKCCHYFDLLNLFAQARPVSVFATGSRAVNFLEFEYEGQKSDIVDNAVVTVIYENGVQASFNLCMFAPMFYEEMVLCGDEGRLKAFENQDFLPVPRSKTGLEILRGESQPARVTTPCYPEFVEASGHSGSTYLEHVNFVDQIEGRKTNAATAAEGFWSIVVGVAAEESIKRGKVVDINDLLATSGIDPESVAFTVP
jgi:predicted dehydrogenase